MLYTQEELRVEGGSVHRTLGKCVWATLTKPRFRAETVGFLLCPED